MGIVDRLRKQQASEQNKGKPLGGGLDEKPAGPLPGTVAIAQVRVHKPVEQDGKRGLRVAYRLSLQKLARHRLVLEVTLHEQGAGPFKSRVPALADALGVLNAWEVFEAADDEPSETEKSVFVPFEAIEVERAGKIPCFARVRVLDRERGPLMSQEEAFVLEAG